MKYNFFLILGCLLIKNIFGSDDLVEIENKLITAYCSMTQAENVNLKKSWKNIYSNLWQEYETVRTNTQCLSMAKEILKNSKPTLGQNLQRYSKDHRSTCCLRSKSQNSWHSPKKF